MLAVFGEFVSLKKEERFVLNKKESHHLARVLRKQAKDKVVLFNGLGTFCNAIIEQAKPQGVVLRCTSDTECSKEVNELHLVQAITNESSVMDIIVRQATEIGVRSITPILCDNTELKRWPPERFGKKLERWREIALNACKQSKNFLLPKVKEIQNFDSFIDQSLEGCKFVASLKPSAFYLSAHDDLISKKTYIFVGPEGDFSSNEYCTLQKNDWRQLRLTRNVLRTETASIYALSLLDSCKKRRMQEP